MPVVVVTVIEDDDGDGDSPNNKDDDDDGDSGASPQLEKREEMSPPPPPLKSPPNLGLSFLYLRKASSGMCALHSPRSKAIMLTSHSSGALQRKLPFLKKIKKIKIKIKNQPNDFC